MKHAERTPKKWKFLLLIGRPVALIGFLMIGYSLSIGLSQSGTICGLGILLLIAGFIAAWTGKIGAFWFYG